MRWRFVGRSSEDWLTLMPGAPTRARHCWNRLAWLSEGRISAMVANLKETLHTLVEQLPEDASIEDVIERLRYLRAVEAGKRAADRGEFASDEDVRRVFAKYGVDT